MSFYREMKALQKELESLGYLVMTPCEEWDGADYSKMDESERIQRKQVFIDAHIEKIRNSDAVLITNYMKNSIENYIWANSFLEIAFAYAFHKPIFLLYNIPDGQNKLEIQSLHPISLNGDIHAIKRYL
jgi:hypothetical protein